MLSSLTINIEQGQVLNFTAGFMSKYPEASSATASYTNENKFTANHVVFKTANTVAGLTAASAINIKSASITITKNVSPDWSLGSTEPDEFYNQQLSVEGTVTLNFTDISLDVFLYSHGPCENMPEFFFLFNGHMVIIVF